MLGVLLVAKPLGITSHDVVNDVRRRFGTKRVGHAGTLDPLGTGLLVVAVGPATRFLQYLPLEPKEYHAQIDFGRATTTYDREGETTVEGPVPEDLETALEAALPTFRGLLQQLPPMHSAVKVAGKPLYKYARTGQEAKREPRTVHVSTFDVEAIEGSLVRAKIVCSGGTYVRSLAHDLGEALGCGAHLAGLQRTRVGRFTLDEASPLESVRPDLLIPLHEALPPMPLVHLDATQVARVREGQAVTVPDPPEGFLAGLLEPSGAVLGVARVNAGLLQPECVIPAEVAHGPA